MIIQKKYFKLIGPVISFFKVLRPSINLRRRNIDSNQFTYKFTKFELIRNEQNALICDGCNKCVEVCPVDCIDLKHKNNTIKKFEINLFSCIYCKECIVKCPIDAIKLSSTDNFDEVKGNLLN